MHHLACVISSVLHPVHSPPGSPHLKCITSSVHICQTRDLQNARATLYALVLLNRHGTDADSKWHDTDRSSMRALCLVLLLTSKRVHVSH